MTRFLLFAFLVACASTPRPVANRNAAPTRYALQPVKLYGGEGHHSASHSSTFVTGALELAGSRTTLHLELQTDTAHIRCPKEWRTDAVSTMQACASDDAKDRTSHQKLALSGEVRQEAGALTTSLRDGDRHIHLRCTEASIGLMCEVAEAGTVFPLPGDQPSQLVFSASARRQYRLDPIALPGGEQLQGTLTLSEEASRVELALPGKPPIVLLGGYYWAPVGLVVQAQTSPTRTWTMWCKDAASRLECEVNADRSVLGQPDHLTGPAVFAAN